MIPNAICIGAQRAGTTWLHECFKEHPQIYVPETKELHFFNHNFEKGPEWYADFFKNATDGQCICEITPNYLNITKSFERMYRMLPDVKILCILRNPVDRAYSAHTLIRDQKKTFSQRIREKNNYLVGTGMYGQQLTELLEYFDKTQIGFFLYDDLKSNPKKFLSEIFSFLGVDSEFVPESLNETKNKIIYPSFQQYLTKIKLGKLLECFKNSSFGKRLKKKIVNQQANKKNISDKDRQFLITQFKEDIKITEKITGKDLEQWIV